MSHLCNANPQNLNGYRIKLYPTEDQKERLNELINLFRYVYNWTIAYEEENYKNGGQFISAYSMFKIFSNIRNQKELWLQNIPINTARHAILKAVHAYEMFFNKVNKSPPSFHKKKNKHNYFIVRGDRLYFKDQHVRIEGFKSGELIYCKNHNIPIGKKYYGCTISFDGKNYWLSLSVEIIEPFIPCAEEEAIGIDLGLRTFATLSDGTIYNFPDTRKLLKRRDRLNRRLQKNLTRAKTKSGNISKNTIKLKEHLEDTYRKISNIRYTFVHTITKEVVEKHPKAIVLEDLDVVSMMHNKYLAKYLSHSMFREFRTQIEYKARRRDIPVIIADKFFPSTQKCYRCGTLNKIGPSKVYHCHNCKLTIDRDLNAALNLKSLATI